MLISMCIIYILQYFITIWFWCLSCSSVHLTNKFMALWNKYVICVVGFVFDCLWSSTLPLFVLIDKRRFQGFKTKSHKNMWIKKLKIQQIIIIAITTTFKYVYDTYVCIFIVGVDGLAILCNFYSKFCLLLASVISWSYIHAQCLSSW